MLLKPKLHLTMVKDRKFYLNLTIVGALGPKSTLKLYLLAKMMLKYK